MLPKVFYQGGGKEKQLLQPSVWHSFSSFPALQGDSLQLCYWILKGKAIQLCFIIPHSTMQPAWACKNTFFLCLTQLCELPQQVWRSYTNSRWLKTTKKSSFSFLSCLSRHKLVYMLMATDCFQQHWKGDLLEWGTGLQEQIDTAGPVAPPRTTKGQQPHQDTGASLSLSGWRLHLPGLLLTAGEDGFNPPSEATTLEIMGYKFPE